MFSRHVFIALLALVTLFTGCVQERSYEGRGRIVGFGDDGRTVIVEHEEIPGLMPAMTMPFTVRDSSIIAGTSTGDAVAFTLTVSRTASRIESVRRLPDDAVAEHPAGAADPAYGGSDAGPLLEAGDPVPDAELVTHADSTMRLSQLQGKTVVLTFIYTRCPLPEYCPLMSSNFARLQTNFQGRLGERVRLLSISFDTAYDTPATLREYGMRYTDDLSTWSFATGDSSAVRDLAERFGVFYEAESEEFLHNLVTAVIGPDGKIRRIWRGNSWDPDDVLRTVAETVS